MYNTINSFASAVADEVKHCLENVCTYGDKYSGVEVKIVEITKNNDQHLTGISIKKADDNIAPQIYLNKYFDGYNVDNFQWEDIINEILHIITNSDVGNFDISDLTDINKVRDKIYIRLINTELNTEYLADKPHTDIEDLSIIYAIELNLNDKGEGSVPITDNLLANLGITKNELHDIAMTNLSKSNAVFKSMRDTMMDIMLAEGYDKEFIDMMIPDDDTNPQMYVLTNKKKLYGANLILNKATMDNIYDTLDGGFVIIPSSIHEVIILPFNENTMDADSLKSMIQEVNGSSLSANEVLSNHPYIYNKSTGICAIA